MDITIAGNLKTIANVAHPTHAHWQALCDLLETFPKTELKTALADISTHTNAWPALLKHWKARSPSQWLHNPPPWHGLVRSVAFEDISKEGFKHFVTSPSVGKLRALDLFVAGLNEDLDPYGDEDALIGNQGAKQLANSTHLSQLTHLNLNNNGLWPEGIEALVKSKHLTQLRHLDVGNSFGGDAAARALAQSSNLCKLESLNLGIDLEILDEVFVDQMLETDGVAAICQSPHLTNLRWLKLNNHILTTNNAAKPIGQAHHLRRLALDLSGNYGGPASIRALLSSHLPDKYTHLKLRTYDSEHGGGQGKGAGDAGDAIFDEGLQIVANANCLHALTHLDLTHNAITDVTALADSPNLPAMTHLSLNTNLISAKSLHRLANSPYIDRLTHLQLGNLYEFDLDEDDLGDHWASILSKATQLRSLTYLSLPLAGITDKGAKLLASSSSLNGLQTLDLRGNTISKEGQEALLHSPHLKCTILLDDIDDEHLDLWPFWPHPMLRHH